MWRHICGPKKRMRQIGNVEVPQEAFLAVLKLD
jgi:translation elongation factor EF-4